MTTYIHGFSAVCAQGCGIEQITRNLFCHPQQPKTITFSLDDEERCVNYFSAFECNRLSLTELAESIAKHINTTLKQCGWQASELANIPIFLASTSFSMSSHEIDFMNKGKDQLTKLCAEQMFSLNEVSSELKKILPNIYVINVATSCTSSTNAIIYAHRYLTLNIIEKAIVVGFESFNSVTLSGFYSLGLLTDQFLAPFSQESRGLILGEGIACIAMSSKPNNHTPLYRLVDGLSHCDASNITTTSAQNLVGLMQSLLVKSSVEQPLIQAIKVNATGCPINDNVEQQSLLASFEQVPPLLFLKPYIGHTLGASGVLEVILLLLCFNHQQLPKPVKYSNHSVPNLMNEYCLANDLPSGYYLLNYLGFGGNNASLLLELSQ